MIDQEEDFRVRCVERELQQWDPTIQIIFNPNCGVAERVPEKYRRPRMRWVVVQRLPDWRPLEWELIGTQGLGQFSQFKVMFICETTEDVPRDHVSYHQPLRPGMWIKRVLDVKCPKSSDLEPERWGAIDRHNQQVAERAEARAAEEKRERDKEFADRLIGTKRHYAADGKLSIPSYGTTTVL